EKISEPKVDEAGIIRPLDYVKHPLQLFLIDGGSERYESTKQGERIEPETEMFQGLGVLEKETFKAKRNL
ncbi:hypothetical protein BgiBS90_010468, partial [Biomphalaria glabrata]